MISEIIHTDFKRLNFENGIQNGKLCGETDILIFTVKKKKKVIDVIF